MGPQHRNAANERRSPASERGASEFFMVVMMAVLVAFAGLAYDAGMAFNARREATNVASAAARAGADKVDTNILYATGVTVLDGGEARSAAHSMISASGAVAVRVNTPNPFEVFVEVEQTHTTTFLGVVGIGSFTVSGEANALVEGRAN